MKNQAASKPKALVTPLGNQRGLATFELIPLILIKLILLSYMFGFFGVIHTGIKQSIAARTYAFEMYRNRANLTHFRGNRFASDGGHFRNAPARTNAIVAEDVGLDVQIPVSVRPIAKGFAKPEIHAYNQAEFHNDQIQSAQELQVAGQPRRNNRLQVNPVWIMVQYGICLNSRCR
jgi:hypothetical protein